MGGVSVAVPDRAAFENRIRGAPPVPTVTDRGAVNDPSTVPLAVMEVKRS